MNKVWMASAMVLAVSVAGCAGVDEAGDEKGTAVEASTSTWSLIGCTVTAGSPDSSMSGYGQVYCPPYYTMSLQVCMQQLVTGGWENVGGNACGSNGPFSDGSQNGSIYVGSGSVSYYTANRWYRTEVITTVSGNGQEAVNQAYYSTTCKGNGSSGCN